MIGPTQQLLWREGVFYERRPQRVTQLLKRWCRHDQTALDWLKPLVHDDLHRAMRDMHLDRSVAIKVLPPEAVADPERKRRFVEEAKAALVSVALIN